MKAQCRLIENTMQVIFLSLPYYPVWVAKAVILSVFPAYWGSQMESEYKAKVPA